MPQLWQKQKMAKNFKIFLNIFILCVVIKNMVICRVQRALTRTAFQS